MQSYSLFACLIFVLRYLEQSIAISTDCCEFIFYSPTWLPVDPFPLLQCSVPLNLDLPTVPERQNIRELCCVLARLKILLYGSNKCFHLNLTVEIRFWTRSQSLMPRFLFLLEPCLFLRAGWLHRIRFRLSKLGTTNPLTNLAVESSVCEHCGFCLCRESACHICFRVEFTLLTVLRFFVRI